MILRSIAELLKDQILVSVAPDARLSVVFKLFDTHDIGAIPVIYANRLVGIIRRDICDGGLATSKSLMACDIMTSVPRAVPFNGSLALALELMFEEREEHMPVLDRTGTVVGMLSMCDIPEDFKILVERARSCRPTPIAAE